MLKPISKLLLEPYPLRTAFIMLARKLKLGSYDWRVGIGAVERPHYGFCVYNSALLAKKLGHKRISLIEFGVAGGNGLLNLEHHAREASKLLGIDIDIYGFDTGEGLPAPVDYRDLPYRWKEGFYRMDVSGLEKRLKKSKLVLGDVKETVSKFFEKSKPAPIAAIMFDLDFYSSTADAMKIFDADEKFFLPRIYCYFDDITGSESHAYSDYTGERLNIREYNETHKNQKFSFAYHFLSRKAVDPWCHRIFIHHNYAHSMYNTFVSDENQNLDLL